MKNEGEPKKVEVKVMALKLETSDVDGNVEVGGEYLGWVDHRFLGMYYPQSQTTKIYLII